MLKQTIKDESTEALKSKDQFKLGVLRMFLAAVATREKEKRYKISKDPAFAEASATEENLITASQLTEEEIIEVLSSEIKKRKDAIALYTQGNRPELADQEKQEIEVLKKYLPVQLSEEEIKKIIEESIVKTGAQEMKDMGRVMADLNPKIKGKADSGEVSKIIKEILSK